VCTATFAMMLPLLIIGPMVAHHVNLKLKAFSELTVCVFYVHYLIGIGLKKIIGLDNSILLTTLCVIISFVFSYYIGKIQLLRRIVR